MEPAVIGLLTAIVGGVMAFAREQVKGERSDKEWWRDKGYEILEKQQEVLETMTEKDEAREDYLRFIMARLGVKQPDKPYDPEENDG